MVSCDLLISMACFHEMQYLLYFLEINFHNAYCVRESSIILSNSIIVGLSAVLQLLLEKDKRDIAISQIWNARDYVAE